MAHDFNYRSEAPTVKIYDSLSDCLPQLAKAQITSLLYSKQDVIETHIMDMKLQVCIITVQNRLPIMPSFQFQSGTYDCGLFSIAYATSMAFRVDPCCYIFDQSRMRRHLYQCFVKRRMVSFPHSAARNTGPRKRDDIEVHCHCRMPELKDVPMIECTCCSKWYHVDCEAVPDKVLEDSLAEWNCKDCQ